VQAHSNGTSLAALSCDRATQRIPATFVHPGSIGTKPHILFDSWLHGLDRVRLRMPTSAKANKPVTSASGKPRWRRLQYTNSSREPVSRWREKPCA